MAIVQDAPIIDVATARRALDAIAHRGPDAAGLWSTPDGRVCLGHRRLAIVDLSPDANQPMLSADGRLAVTLNGEIYNFRALRTRKFQINIPFYQLCYNKPDGCARTVRH